MPSTSHPVTRRVEEELHNLKIHLASSCRTAQGMSSGLKSVGDLYESVEELVCLPSNQQSLLSNQRKFVEEQLDESLKLLDLVGAVKDSLVSMREHVEDLQTAIRRKSNPVTDLRKKVQKAIKNCLKSLKKVDRKSHISIVAVGHRDLLVNVLIEARESIISLLQSIISFLLKPKQNKWLAISKSIYRRKVVCEMELDNTIEVEKADVWLHASYNCLDCKDFDVAIVVKAQNDLVSLEVSLESIELGLKCLFRRLIQNRVSLLNVLSL